MKPNFVTSLVNAVPLVAIFICVMAFGLYHYPDVDWQLYRSLPNFHSIDALTVYHPYDFGWIHTPSVFLTIWFVFALWVTPRASRGMNAIMFGLLKAITTPASTPDEGADHA